MSQTLLRSAAIIMIITLVGRAIGFLRDTLLAHQFGNSFVTDAFGVAYSIPYTIFLFVPGALNAIFLPTIKQQITLNQKEEATSLFKKMFSFTTLLYFGISILGFVYSENIVRLLAPSYTGEELRMTTQMLQIMWPSALFIGLIGMFQSTLNAHQQYFYPTLSTVVNSLIIIASYPLLVPYLGIYGVAIGTTLGFLFAALTMLPSIFKSGYSLKPDFHWNTLEMRKIGERFFPIMLGSVVTQMTVFIELYLAVDLGEGKLSSLKRAFTVYQLPMAIFVGAFILPIFPYLVEHFTNKNFDKMKASMTEGMRYLFLLLFPTILALVLIPNEIISFLYQWGGNGQFDALDVEWTGIALIFYSVGLFFLAQKDLLTRAFYAMENTRIPVIVAVISIVVYTLVSKLLIPYMDHGGIALGSSIGALFHTLLLSILLRKRIGSFVLKDFWKTAIKTVLASAIMGIILLVGKSVLPFETLTWAKVSTLALIIIGATSFLISMILFKEPLVLHLLQNVSKRILKR